MKPDRSRLPTRARVQSQPLLGLLEWFRPEEYDRVEAVLADMHTLGIEHLRTGFSWADWHTDQGKAWYAWLLPRLARQVDVLPCFTYTPPSLGVVPKTSAPPRCPKDYADFLDVILTQFGQYFEWVELWNEPNNLNDWDWRLDPSWQIFCDMMQGAAYWVRQRGKKTVLGGMCPTDPHWLDLLGQRHVLHHIDAVGVHGFPGTWEFDWQSWPDTIARVQRVLDQHHLSPEIWITEAGYSTWRHDEHRQLKAFVDFLAAPVQRAYWYAAYDLPAHLPHQDGFHEDERHYHFGLKRTEKRPKLLFRIWAHEGLDGVKELARRDGHALPGQTTPSPSNGSQHRWSTPQLVRPRRHSRPHAHPVLIVGGAGFIGTNLAHRLLTMGKSVRIFDNLSRPGVEQNLRWLCDTYGSQVQVHLADLRHSHALHQAVQHVQHVFHLAAQVAVTTSVEAPLEDAQVNLLGTLHVLEALRTLPHPPSLVFTSTNKVYGDLSDVALYKQGTRYAPTDPLLRRCGIGEKHALDFRSPYGCSKGAADQYVLDYARTYDLPAVVFRMSCIYGTHQYGTEDQGWVAHFLVSALSRKVITIFGDGLQVRDVLFVQDLVDALLLAQASIDTLAGETFNIGGGPANTTSLIELIDLISTLHGEAPLVRFAPWRTGDQKYYVSNTQKFASATGWAPRVSVREGVQRLYDWLLHTMELAAVPCSLTRVEAGRGL